MVRRKLWYVASTSVVLGGFVACADAATINDTPAIDGGSSTSSSSSSSSASSSSGSPDNGSSGAVDSGTSSGTDADADDSGMPDSGDSDAADAADAGDDAGDDAGADAGLPATATPTFTTTPAAGPFTTAVQVMLASATPNATILYSLDGANPNTNVYLMPINLTQTTTIRAEATAPGHEASDVASTTITINFATGCCTEPVSFIPDGTTVRTNTFNVALSNVVADATICYTTDGVANPTCTNGVCGGASQTYHGGTPIPITQTQTVVAALACKAGSTNTGITSQTYRLQAASVSATPGAGTMAGPVDVVLSSITDKSTIHYSTDGSAVTCTTGVVAPSPATVHLTTTTTLTAIACEAGFEASASNAFTYTLH